MSGVARIAGLQQVVSSLLTYVFSNVDKAVVPVIGLLALSGRGRGPLSSSGTLQRISPLTTGFSPVSLVALGALGLSKPSAVVAASDSIQKRAIGEEFPVTSTNGHENIRGVVKLTNGNVVVLWGNGVTLRGKMINPLTQQTVGSEFSLTFAQLSSSFPPFTDMGALSNGGFVVSYVLREQGINGFIDVQRLQFYNSNVEPTTLDRLGNQLGTPRFTVLADGKLAVVINTGSYVSSIYVYSSTNERLSTASISPVNRLRQVLGGKALPDGRVVIVGRGDLNGRTSFVAEVYNLNGQIIKNRFVISDRYDYYRFVSLTPLTGNRFLLLYEGSSASLGYKVHFAIFDSNNEMVGEIQQVNTIFGGTDSNPYAIALPDGGFSITWASTDISGYGILSQQYTSSGQKRGEERRVNVEMGGDQKSPYTVLLNNMNLFYLWETAMTFGADIRGRVLPTVPATTTTTSTTTTSTTSTSTTTTSTTSTSTIAATSTATSTAVATPATTTGEVFTTAVTTSRAPSTSQSPVSSVQTTSEKVATVTTPRFSAPTAAPQLLSTTARVVTRILATTTALGTVARGVPPGEPFNPLIPVVVVLALLCVSAVLAALAALALLRRERDSDGTELGRLSGRSRSTRSSSSTGTSHTTSHSTERRRRHGGGGSASRPGRHRNEIYAGFPPLPSSTGSSTLRTIEPSVSGRSSRSGARGERIYDVLPVMGEKQDGGLSSHSSRGAEPVVMTTTTARGPVQIDPDG